MPLAPLGAGGLMIVNDKIFDLTCSLCNLRRGSYEKDIQRYVFLYDIGIANGALSG